MQKIWRTAFKSALLAIVLQGGMAWADDSLYQELGGQNGIKSLVTRLLPLLQADQRIAQSFKDADMANLSEKLIEQFCAVSGGPCTYTGKNMKEIHDGLNITQAQFNALVEDLQQAMQTQNIAMRAQNRLLAKLAPMQRDVVTK